MSYFSSPFATVSEDARIELSARIYRPSFRDNKPKTELSPSIRAQDCCDFSIGSQMLYNHSARSHPR